MKPISVLIADNHATMRRTLRKVLDFEMNIEVVGEAVNGKEAIDKVEKLKPEVVLMDIKMPVMDGLKSATYIKKHYPETKVIILSAYNHKNLIEEAKELGVAAYILKNKPVDVVIKTILWESRNEEKRIQFPLDESTSEDKKEETDERT